MNDLINKMTEAEKYKDTIRCMSEVLTDIANELSIPEDQHGDPDLILEAIEQLRKCQQQDGESISELVEALEMALYAKAGNWQKGSGWEKFSKSAIQKGKERLKQKEHHQANQRLKEIS